MKIIELTQGQAALIDDEDFDVVSRFKWRAKIRHGVWYAVRHTPMIDGKRTTQALHQFILPGVARIDHKNRDGLDNQKENLRPASRCQNSANSKKREATTSKFKGVHWVTAEQIWRAQIGYENTMIWLGNFSDEIEAARAYDVAAKKIFGEFARLNLTFVE